MMDGKPNFTLMRTFAEIWTRLTMPYSSRRVEPQSEYYFKRFILPTHDKLRKLGVSEEDISTLTELALQAMDVNTPLGTMLRDAAYAIEGGITPAVAIEVLQNRVREQKR